MKIPASNRQRGSVLVVTMIVLLLGMMVVGGFYQYFTARADVAVLRAGRVRNFFWQDAQLRLLRMKTQLALINNSGVDSSDLGAVVSEIFAVDPNALGLPIGDLQLQ